MRSAWELNDAKGLNAAIYTQLTDVETEANGLLTYDREVLKVDPTRVAAINRGDLSRVPQVVPIVPTSRDSPVSWKYAFTKPAEGWERPGFDDSGWKSGAGGFGTRITPNAVVRTEWSGADAWVRRSFELPEVDPKSLVLLLFHDEDAEVFLNGILAAKVQGYITNYDEVPISAEALASLKPGKNTIAIHCRQTGGGQFVDCGIAEIREPKR